MGFCFKFLSNFIYSFIMYEKWPSSLKSLKINLKIKFKNYKILFNWLIIWWMKQYLFSENNIFEHSEIN